jgi:O-antigen ligase
MILAPYYLYVLLAPLEYIQQKLPQGPGGVNYANLMMIVMILACIGWRVRSGLPLITPLPLSFVLVIYLVHTYAGLMQSCLSIPEATCPISRDSPALQSYLRVANGVLFFWLAATFIDSRRRFRHLLLVLASSAALAFRAFYSDLAGVLTWHYSDDMRVRGPFVWLGSNELAAYFTFLGTFMALVALAMDRWWQRLILWAAAGFCAYGVLFGYSRGAWLAVLVSLAFVAALRHRWLCVPLLIAALTTSLWLPASVQDRLAMTRDESGDLEESAASRQEFARYALQEFPNSPFFGHGAGSYRLTSPWKMDTHNLYLRTLFEGGIVGICLLLAIWAALLHVAVGLWTRAENPLDRRVGMSLFVATVGLMTANLFGDRFTHLALMAQFWTIAGAAARLHTTLSGREFLQDEEDGHQVDNPAAGEQELDARHEA